MTSTSKYSAVTKILAMVCGPTRDLSISLDFKFPCWNSLRSVTLRLEGNVLRFVTRVLNVRFFRLILVKLLITIVDWVNYLCSFCFVFYNKGAELEDCLCLFFLLNEPLWQREILSGGEMHIQSNPAKCAESSFSAYMYFLHCPITTPNHSIFWWWLYRSVFSTRMCNA